MGRVPRPKDLGCSVRPFHGPVLVLNNIVASRLGAPALRWLDGDI